MGLINPDNYTTFQGIQKTGTYICIGPQQVSIRKNGEDLSGNELYEVNAIANVYWDQSTRLSNNAPIASISVSTKITVDGLGQNMYSLLYGQLLLKLPNATQA